MAIGFPAGITAQYIVNNAQTKLAALRNALHEVVDFQQWLSAYSAADLEAAPLNMDATSAGAIFSAFADANGLAQIYFVGADPRTPPANYVYATSQRVIIGPLS